MTDDEFRRQFDRAVIRESRFAFLLGLALGATIAIVAMRVLT